MAKASKLKDSRVCRIFFSSPFGGMEDEREILTRKYFPQIHHLCNSRGVQFVAVDMRWGITKEAGENAQVINICLRELDRSDMFVGFFGQRYGWHGDKDELLQQNFDNAVSRYTWLDKVRDKSVTELEFLHGHLNSPGSLPACIYFRDKAYDDKIRDEAMKKGDKKGVFKYSAESELSTSLMEDLKKRVKTTEDQLLDLDLKYPDPAQVAEKMFNCIWKQLTEVLLVDSDVEKLSPREQDLLDHNAFLANHMSVYCGNTDYIHQLNSTIDSKKSLLVSGIAGSGKSALLSNWVEDLKKNTDLILVYHFIGCSSNSTRPMNIVERLLHELEQHLPVDEKKEDKKSINKDLKAADLQKLLQDLRVVMEKISSQEKQAVIIIDGLDKLMQANKTEKPLYWLPNEIPSNISIILSTIEGDMELDTQLITERKFDQLNIKPLDPATQQLICTKSLMMYGKELSPDQMKRIIDAEQTQNPLFLMITVSEIVVFGYFRLLDKKIDSLITCNSVEELFENYLQRLEEDYNVSTFPGNLVEKVLLAILFSRNGISETELKEILDIPDSVWSPLYFAMEKYVIQHSGLLNFGFQELKTAVEKKYLKSPQDGKTILKQMIEYFEKKRKGLDWSVLRGDHNVSRCSIELPFLQKQSGDKEGLLTTITDLTVFQSLFQEHNYEIIELWEATGCDTSEIIDRYLTNFDVRIADIYLKRQQNLDKKYSSPPGVQASELLTDLRVTLGYVQKPVEGIKIMKRQIQILENSKECMDEKKRQEALVRCQYFLAAQYVEMEDYETGVPIHEKIISDLEKLKEAGSISIDSLIVLAMSYNDIGVTLVSRGEYEEAEKYFYKSMDIESAEGLKQEEGECLMNIALCRLQQGDTDKALELYLKTLEIFEDVFFGQLNHNLGQLMTNIGLTYRRQNKLEEAEKYYNRSLKIKAQALGWDNPDVAYVYMNLSVIEQLRENLPKSIELITKAELIFKKRNTDLYTNANYRKVFENRVLYIVLQQRYEDAEEEYQTILNVLVDKGLMDFCLKGLHLEMLKFYIRSEEYDKATKTALALLSRTNPEPTDFTYLDHLDALKPIEERPQREYKYSLERAFELWPDNGDIGRRLARNNYIPRDLTDKLLQHLQKIDENVEGLGAMTYGYASDWCCEDQKQDLALTVLRKGFEFYPDSMEIIDRFTTILREKKDYAGLLEFLQPVTKRIDNSALHYIAGYSAVMQAQFDLARELLKRIIDKDSDPDPDIMLQKAKDLYNSIDQFESEMEKHNAEQSKRTESK